jgi:DNA-binding MarR family transcriptional regulator
VTSTGEPVLQAPSACSRLAGELSRHARTLHLFKSQMARWLPSGLDQAAVGVLMTLVKGGPRRQGELADVTFLDPSTISRHVGQLARAGFVERRPDPVDGRAVQLVATPAGFDLGHELSRRRDELVTTMVARWDQADVEQLVTLLRRLNDDLEGHCLAGRTGPQDPYHLDRAHPAETAQDPLQNQER